MENKGFEFPQIIKDVVKGLDNDTRLKIVEYIVNNGSVSYSNLLRELNIPRKGSLTFHLDVLSKSAIINRYEDFDQKNNEWIFYDISILGKDIINGLLAALAPMQNKITIPNEDKFSLAASGEAAMNTKYAIEEYSQILPPITAS
jgi:hypothetical protein